MGGMFKAPEQKSTTTNTPWGPQGEALQYGFDQLKNTIGSKLGTPYYQGDLYAGMDPLTNQGIAANTAYATGAGAQAAGAVGPSAQGLLPTGQKGTGAFDKLLQMGSTDPTQANITSAGKYADNPWMSGMIDAASRDVTRNLYENELPGLNMAASGSGNINSSRAGVAEGIMKRGAADQIGDIAATLRGNAYSQGLGLAEQGRQANMGAVGAAGSGYGDIYDLGLKGSAVGQDMSMRNNDALITGGQLNQQDAQGPLNANFQRWQGQDTRDMGFLNQYMQMVSGVPGYGTQTSTQTGGGASPFGQVLGAATSALGAFKMFSDPELKTNVQDTGRVTPKHGIPIKTFDYIETDGLDLPRGRQVGVMATDVAKVLPEAVSVDRGYLTVDYGKLR